MIKMRTTLLIIAAAFTMASCKKDKYTTAPQIKFNDFTPNTFTRGSILPPEAGPFLSIQLTDAEGDFGFAPGEDTSYLYIKNVTIAGAVLDSIPFPTSGQIKRNDLNAEVVVNLSNARSALIGTPTVPTHPYVDTLHFEVYVKDFAKNKSNVITTPGFYHITP